MADLTSFQAKICYTATGTLIHQNKILLVKHKKLGFWLTPGGHVDPNEMPHQAAEREFWEETGLKVKAINYGFYPDIETEHVEFVPNPIEANLHWISRENYDARTKDASVSAKTQQDWGERGCEQHLSYRFLVEATDGYDFKQNVEETDGISWFTLDEIADLETTPTIKLELKEAFRIWNSLPTNQKT